MFSIRCVTKKPPVTLIAAKKTPSVPKMAGVSRNISVSKLASSNIPPMTMIPEMAFVTDISGVCNEGVTFQTTM